MSCPKCGSGAVFQGKCRECGTIADPRRASQVVARIPTLGDEEPGDATIADRGARKLDPESTMAPPGRRPGAGLAPADDEDEDSERTRMPVAAKEERAPPASPPAPKPPAAKPPRASQVAARPKPAEPEPPEPLQPMAVKDRSSWYEEAGLKPPPKPSPKDELGTGENSVSMTMRGRAGPNTAPAAVLFAQAAAGMLGVLFGLSPIGLIAGGAALIAAILLVRDVSAGKFVAWLAVGIFIAYGGALAVSFKQPVAAALLLVPSACLAGALLISAQAARSALGGIGVAVALAAVIVPALAARRPGGTEAGLEEDDPGAYEDRSAGVSLRVPGNVNLYPRPKDVEKSLPEPWRSVGLKLGFATSDGSFVGGMLQTRQPPGAELRNLLAPISEGSTAPPRKNDRLVPDGLSELETEGWEVSTRAGELLVVVTRAPDGRAFTLFGVAGTAKARNTQLFKAIGEGFQVKKHLRAE
ncbi:MAG: hypothetical protein QM765_12975 [Myxococcales bacterium]